MKYIAHYDEKEHIEQSVKEHLEGVGSLAAGFCADFVSSEYGAVLGQMHDIGKYSSEFQEYLLHGIGFKGSVDHSSAGAQELYKLFKDNHNEAYLLLSMCVAGHHGGLLNYGDMHQKSDFCGRIKKKNLPDYSNYSEDININDINNITCLDKRNGEWI